MKKILALLVIVVLAIGGCNMIKNEPTKEEMIEVLKSREVVEAIERAIHNREEKALTSEGVIKEYEIIYNGAKWESRGAIEVKILVNNDKNLYFIYTIRKFNDKYEVSSSTNSEVLEELLGEK
ncbi:MULTISPECIES: DUF1310 family protein [unclassified Granulicatella]|uniref:DUF1310 family protein n=1 Tax=unclassified Granulicatella TaxID=2630493 RepID=UPI0014306D0D|nr:MULTISPECIES: DUF1310 family protein [unclassified Granulicatella]MBF0780362.1 DUF1310 family protein [Granulicatella sp. 19428wC4_WM01]